LEFVEVRRVEKEIDVWEASSKRVLLVGNHTAGEDNRHLRFATFQPDQRVELAGDLVLGRLANHTRIENDDVGFIFRLGWAVTDLLEHSSDLGAIGLVHLAANRPNEESLAILGKWLRSRRGMKGNRWIAGHAALNSSGIRRSGSSRGNADDGPKPQRRI